VEVTPPERLLWFLSNHGRQQIYSVLGQSAANYSQANPFRFPSGTFDLRFKDSGLPLEDISLIKRLSYTKGDSLCFSDLETVQGLLKPEDFNDLLETLYAIPAYSLRVRVTEDTDVDAMVRYWGRGGREKLIAPLLHALARVPHGGTMNVSYLLPPFARLRLYTYPESWDDPEALKEDCFFSALNFFNQRPDTNFLSEAYSRRILERDYSPVRGEPTFGDIIMLISAEGMGIHLCVYLADGFVFTKNGVTPASPWVIMRLEDMLALYFPPPQGEGSLLTLRRKE
jgi:hypothetical protein